MAAIVNPVIPGKCKNCGKTTRGAYVAVKKGQYSHTFDCTGKKAAAKKTALKKPGK